MSAEDYMPADLGMFDGEDHCGYRRYYPRPAPRCHACFRGGLSWGATPKGWRLYEGLNLHHCQKLAAPSPDDFTVVA